MYRLHETPSCQRRCRTSTAFHHPADDDAYCCNQSFPSLRLHIEITNNVHSSEKTLGTCKLSSFFHSLHFYNYIILLISIIDSFLVLLSFLFIRYTFSKRKVTICIQFQNKHGDVHLNEAA
jgi:hypothetical protein